MTAHTTEDATTTTTAAWALSHGYTYQLERLAGDLGRLRRRLPEDDFANHLIDRISHSIQTIDAILQPTAGELHQHGWTLEHAVASVDRRDSRIRQLLGEAAR